MSSSLKSLDSKTSEDSEMMDFGDGVTPTVVCLCGRFTMNALFVDISP